MNQCGSSCWPVEHGVSAALRFIQQIMTVVLRRKLNVKLLPLISAKCCANYIQELENPVTVCHFLLTVWSKKIKEDTRVQRPLPSITPSSSLQNYLTVWKWKLVWWVIVATLCHCAAVEAENGRFTPGMSQQSSENSFFKSGWRKNPPCVCDSSNKMKLYSKKSPFYYCNTQTVCAAGFHFLIMSSKVNVCEVEHFKKQQVGSSVLYLLW